MTPVRSIISDAAPARKAKPGEKWDPVTKTGADGTIGIDPALGQIANSSPGDHRRRRDRRRQLVASTATTRSRSRNIPGFDARLRRPHRQAALEVQPRAAAGRVRRGDVEERLEDRHARASARTTPWATVCRGSGARVSSTSRSACRSCDEYGGHRPGDNLYGNSLVALDVKTGKRKWHFQMVHHDIWDYDTPMSPNLMDITVNGRPRKVDRADDEAGLDLHVRSRDGRADLADGGDAGAAERRSRASRPRKTQPIPSKPAPYSQQGLVEADLIDYTPAIKDSALKLAKTVPHGAVLHPAVARRTAPTRASSARGMPRARAAA